MNKPQRMGLTTRLLLLGLVPSMVLTLALGWLLDSSIRDSLYGGLAQRLNDRADRIQANIIAAPTGSLRYEAGRSSDEFSQIFSGWYWVLQAPDQQLVSRSLWDATLPTPTANAPQPLLRNTGPRGQVLLGVARPLSIESHPGAELYVYALANEVTDDLSRIRRILWLVLAALLGSMAATTWMQVRVGLQPLQLLRQRLAALHTTTASNATHLGEGYGPDLDPIAQEVDALLDRNARMVARGRAHAADLSHALKTPLARLSAEAGLAHHVPSPLVQAQVHSINGLIERHLSRTSSAGDQAPHLQSTIALHEVALQLSQLLIHIRPERALSWQIDVPAALHWRGDRSDLEEMLGNVMDNASKWARSQVHVHAALVETGRGRSQLVLTVEDDGPGIPAHLLKNAGLRGERFDENTPGSGLGLSIVADIAHTWNGELALSASALGGLRAQLTLPT